MLISFFCKKGGVGKTTVTGEFAGYLTTMGKRVLVISIDDQNSLFEMFGLSSKVFDATITIWSTSLPIPARRRTF